MNTPRLPTITARAAGPARAAWPARSTLLVLALAALAGCGGDAELPPELAEDRQPELLALVYDRSSSLQDHELEHFGELTSQRLGELRHGDRIVAFELLQQSLDEPPRRWAQPVPEREYTDRLMPRDSVTRARFVQDARDYLAQFTEVEERGEIRGTDILSTLHLVGTEIQAWPEHRATVVIYSDMLQANQVMNMEAQTRMPPADWVASEAEAGTLPDLGEACIVVIGARVDTPASQQVREFWQEYFEATGAQLPQGNYQHRGVRIPERPCG